MGRFKREKKLYRLKFDAEQFPDLEGFECIASGTTLARFLEITALAEELKTAEGQTPENVEKQYRMFAGYLQSWNLDGDDDQPLPCTYEGLLTLEIDFVQAIIAAWQQAMAGVPKASSEDSDSGATSEAESRLQLASLSESRAS